MDGEIGLTLKSPHIGTQSGSSLSLCTNLSVSNAKPASTGTNVHLFFKELASVGSGDGELYVST